MPGILYSIIIPLYNKQEYIKDLLSNFLISKYKDFEIIVVDDQSTDNSYEIVSNIDDSRLLIIRQPVNAGASSARNIGASQARGSYVFFIDADDIATYDFHEKIRTSLTQLNCPEIISYEFGFTLKSDVFRRIISRKPLSPRLALFFFSIFRHHFTSSNVLLSKRIFFESNGFSTELRSREDPEFYFRLLMHASFPIHYSSDQITVYRRVDNSLSATTGLSSRDVCIFHSSIEAHQVAGLLNSLSSFLFLLRSYAGYFIRSGDILRIAPRPNASFKNRFLFFIFSKVIKFIK